jgi:prepilin-type processing-associated H-X9-DG protein
MKQMALGIMMYVQDYDETYPKANFWNTSTPFSEYYLWTSQRCVQPYIKNRDLYRCPSDSFAATQNAAFYGLPADRVPVPITYMANSITPFYFMFGVNEPRGLMPYGTEHGGTPTATAMAAVPFPADIYLLVEGRKEYYGDVQGCAAWLNNEIDWCYATADVAEQWVVDYFTLSVPTDTWYKAWRKHTGSINVAYGDGHVKSQRPGDMRDARRWIINPLP